MKKVSVLIPSYNHAAFIEEAIESVLCQTYDNFELLISDDCSNDNTVQILEQYRTNDRVHLFIQPMHIGAVEQIHFLADRANGDYIALLNSDDYWEPEKLKKQIDLLDSHIDIDACFTQALMIDEYGLPITNSYGPKNNIFIQPNRSKQEWKDYFFKKGNCLLHPSIMARKGIYKNRWRLNQGLRQLPDYDLWTRYIFEHQIFILQEILALHRRIKYENTSAATEENINLHLREQAWIRAQMIDRMSDNDIIEIFNKELLCNDYSSVKITCEKFFILARMGETNSAMLEQAINFYLNHARDKEFVQTMMQVYSFKDADFFSISQQSKVLRKPRNESEQTKLKAFSKGQKWIRGIRRIFCGKYK